LWHGAGALARKPYGLPPHTPPPPPFHLPFAYTLITLFRYEKLRAIRADLIRSSKKGKQLFST
jgi:hypothetical protein